MRSRFLPILIHILLISLKNMHFYRLQTIKEIEIKYEEQSLT